MNTPFFLIRKDLLTENVRCFRKGMSDCWHNSRLAYSVKTNSLPWVLRYMKSQGLLAEVVSDEEYELALKCGFADSEIIFNGPIKTEPWFLRALRMDAWVNIDSERELQWLEQSPMSRAKVGIRVNVPTELFLKDDIGYQEDGFRFGFDVESGAFEHALHVICSAIDNPELGLHLHCNSMTRNPEVYKTIAAYAVSLMDRFSLRISFLDIGGGFFGGVPGKTKPAEYFSVIVEQLRQANTRSDYQLIAEPGSALIGSTVELHTSVLDIKDIEKSRIVTTDGSRICIDPLWSKKGYTYRTQPIRTEKTERRQVICGYTCMDHDRLMVIENGPALHVGDQIIYERVGAYSMTFGGPFIRNYPDVFVLDENGMEKIRDRFSVDTYYKLHTCFLDGE